MIREVFCGFFSNLMVKFWQSRKYFHLTISAVVAASFQALHLISKKCAVKQEKLLIYLGVCYFDVSLFYKSGSKQLKSHHIVWLSRCVLVTPVLT